jgi:hypothetical protein
MTKEKRRTGRLIRRVKKLGMKHFVVPNLKESTRQEVRDILAEKNLDWL